MGDNGWEDMPPLITSDITSSLSKSLAELAADQNEPFATVLHGGEPLMLGARKLETLLKSLRNALPAAHPICMQTNGMLLTESLLEICVAYRVSISVSIDGPEVQNDKFRVDHRNRGTFERVLSGLRKLKEHDASQFLFSGTLSVIDPSSDPRNVYEFLKSLGSPSLDFLYRDGNHTSLPYGKKSWQSTEYGDWLITLIDVYLTDRSPPRIRFIDDLIRLLLGSSGIKEGLGTKEYGIIVIESDGSIAKNDTLKSAYNGADRFTETWNIKEDRIGDIVQSETYTAYHETQKPTSLACLTCEYLNICGGGMPLHRWESGSGFNNPSIYCNDQKKIITHLIRQLSTQGISCDFA